MKAYSCLKVDARPVAVITYKQLEYRVLAASSKGNLRRNRAALLDWKAFHQTNDDDPIGPELSNPHYLIRLNEYAGHVKPRLAAGYANRISGIRQVQSIYEQMLSEMSRQPEAFRDGVLAYAEAFTNVCKQLEMTVSQVAREYGCKSVFRWANGTHGFRTPKAVWIAEDLERRAGRPGYLTRFARTALSVTRVADFSHHRDPYRSVFSKSRESRYYADLERPELRPIWDALQSYICFKTALVPSEGLRRSKRWSRNKAGTFPTATKFSMHVEAFFGWLMLPPDSNPKNSGLGAKPEHLSFALLGCFELTTRFWAFRAARGEIDEGVFSGCTLSLFEFLCGLTRKETGWLAQTEQTWLKSLKPCVSRLGLNVQEVKSGYFSQQHQKALAWMRETNARNTAVRLRNPWITCKPFLDSPSPMKEWIYPLVRNMMRDRPGPSVPVWQRQSHERDIMMIVAFFSVPLRAINWRLCEVGSNIYRNNRGEWVLHVTREEFKNRALLPKHFQYTIKIPGWAQPFFSYYVDNVLSILPRDSAGVCWLLPKLQHKLQKTSGETLCIPGAAQGHYQLADRFAKIFGKYFGFEIRPHAARHIVTTNYLKADPRNLEIAAVLLNDKPETVRREYANLITQDYFRHFDIYSTDQASSILSSLKTF